MNLVVPGAGHVFRCRNQIGLTWFAMAALGYLVDPVAGLFVHGLSIWHALESESA